MKPYPRVRRLANLFVVMIAVGIVLVFVGAILAIWGHEQHRASTTIFFVGFGGWLIFIGGYLLAYSRKLMRRHSESRRNQSGASELSSGDSD